MEENQQNYSLPDNAYTELKPGESYKPILPAGSKPKEVTPYSVTMGLIMAILFSAAAAYLGLKVGQVFEAAIPIAIIAVGVGNIFGKKNTLGQNTIIQSIGASSGVIVAGVYFSLPALYILGLEAQFYQIFLSSLFGGCSVSCSLYRSGNISSRTCTESCLSRKPPRLPRCLCRARRRAIRPRCWLSAARGRSV